MLTGWTDGKRFLAENSLTLIGIVLSLVLWDLVVNFAIAVNLYRPAHELAHPYLVGAVQAGVALILALIQIGRNVYYWQFWK